MRVRIDLSMSSASFDGRGLLGSQAQDIEIQVGLNIVDKLKLA